MCCFSTYLSINVNRNDFSLWNVRLALEAILMVISFWLVIFQECGCQQFAFSLVTMFLSLCVCVKLSKKGTCFWSQKLQLFLPMHMSQITQQSLTFFLRKLFRWLGIYFAVSLTIYHVRIGEQFHTLVFLGLFVPASIPFCLRYAIHILYTSTNLDS